MRGNDLLGLLTESTTADTVVDMHVFSKHVTAATGASATLRVRRGVCVAARPMVLRGL